MYMKPKINFQISAKASHFFLYKSLYVLYNLDIAFV